jgi:plasmid rolling circle replication initiator protein Rep
LSEHESDEDFAVVIVPPSPEKTQEASPPGLANLSDRDQVWDKHRANADKVSNHYRGNKRFDHYSQRMDFCSQLLDFRLVPESEEGVLKLKLSASRFCRVRTCPVCQWRRSLMWKAKAYQALPKVVKDFPKHRWLFLTLTVKNCPVEELRSILIHLNKSFVRLTKLKDWPADGASQLLWG